MAENGNSWASFFGNPKFKQFASEGLADLGYGLSTATDFGGALGAATQRSAQMEPYRALQAEKMGEKTKLEEQSNATADWLRRQGATDLADAIGMGSVTGKDAFNLYYQKANAPGPDPFTLGKGQIRYDGAGNMIAQGTAGGPDTLINNNIGGSDDFYKKLDTDLGAGQALLIDAGRNAQSNNIRLGQLDQHLQAAPQGAQGAMVQFAGSLGIPVEGIDDVQAAQALINQMVPGQRPAGSGTMSDADLALFKQSLPSIINQPGGNQRIIQTTKAINEYTIAQAQIAQQVANREISPADGRAMQAAIPNPLAGYSVGAPMAPGAPGGGIDGLVQKYNY